MNELVILHEAQSNKILQTAIDNKVPATMSYLSEGKWHNVKVLFINLEADRLTVRNARPQKRPDSINIQVHQPVGISLRYGYGKFVFDTTVLTLEPAEEPTCQGRSGADTLSQSSGSGNLTVALAVPDQIEAVQERCYLRANVPESLNVNVLLWHRRSERQVKNQIHSTPERIQSYCKGRLVDISASGARVVIPQPNDASQDFYCSPTPKFKKGQFIGMRFTPVPYEKPLMLNARIRNVLPTADGNSNCLGLQIVGLEASPEGRRVLTRLIDIIKRYYQINQSSARQQDMQPVPDIV